MNSEHEIADWTVTRWNAMEHDAYFDPPVSDTPGCGIELFDPESMKETVIDVEMDGKWKRLVINNNGWHWEEIGLDYWHSQEYLQVRTAYIRAKRRYKIEHKQKRAAFRRLKRGLA